MRVFLTGATGFIGSAVVAELLGAGHEIAGLARSDAAAAVLEARGVDVLRGDVARPESLVAGAKACDGVIHCAFGHDFSKYAEAGEADLRAVTAMCEALAGTAKPLVVTSGMTARTPGRLSTETDAPEMQGLAAVRGRPEDLTLAAAATGVRAVVVRLPPSVHDRGQQGLVTQLVDAARRHRVSAYLGDGQNRWPAVHRRDAARLFRLALENGQPGDRFHAVAEEGIALREIAEAIGETLATPVRSIDTEEAARLFGWLTMSAGSDMPASSAATRRRLGWRPTGPSLLEGIRGNYLRE